MNNNRREFIGGTSAVFVTSSIGFPSASDAKTSSPIKAIAFDAFPIFDSRGISALATEIFGDMGKDLAALWSNKLFGYSWFATSAGHYQDFQSLAECALHYTAISMGVRLSDAEKYKLINKYNELSIWPDVIPALEVLKSNGIRLRFLSNLGHEALASSSVNNKISAYFEAPLSTDLVRRFKPAPEAYAMAINAFCLPREQIGFVAFGGWDAIGATWFGYRTAWVNRLGLPAESIGPNPEITTRGIEGALSLTGLA